MSGKKPPKKKDVLIPTPVNPEQEEQEARLIAAANKNFELEANLAKAPVVNDEVLPGVPMDEDLDPAKIEEYCEREPWLLSPLFNMASSGKYGIIPERFKHKAGQLEQEGRTQEAAAHMEAYDKGRKLYWRQMQKSFRELESKMSRKQIGMFAQNLWVSTTIPVEEKGAGISRFFDRARLDQMDPEMQELARDAVYKASRWMAMVINEIPLDKKPGPKPGPVH